MAATREQRPEVFFKVLLASQIKTLTFPPVFARRHASELSNAVTLMVPNGRDWLIGLKIEESKIAFEENWSEFVEYHSIDIGYFLFFLYEGGSRFHVHICDSTACEIEYPEHFVELSDEEEEAEDLGFFGTNPNGPDLRFRDLTSTRSSQKRKRGKATVTDQRPNLDSVEIEDVDSAKSSDSEGSGPISEKIKKRKVGTTSKSGVRERKSASRSKKTRKGYLKRTRNQFNEQEEGCSRPKSKRLKRERPETDSETDSDWGKKHAMKMKQRSPRVDLEANKGLDQNLGSKLKKKNLKKHRKTDKGSSERLDKKLEKKSFKTYPEKGNDSADLTNADHEIIIGRRFFSQASSPQKAIRLVHNLNLKNPSFVHVLREHNIDNSCVYVPEEFVARGLTGDFNSIKIVDPEGFRWTLQIQRKKTHAYLRGCNLFLKSSSLNPGDICVFELIDMGARVSLKLWVLDHSTFAS